MFFVIIGRVMFMYICYRWEDIECLSYSSSLCEISLDGNPIAADVCYKQIVIKSMPQLRQLDMKRITVSSRYRIFSCDLQTFLTIFKFS